MSKHNQRMRWVLGGLGLLLYMGSLGTQVVCTLLLSHSSLPLLYPQTQYGIAVYHSQSLMQHHSPGAGYSKFVSDSSSYFGSCLYFVLCQGWELLRFSSSLTDHLFQAGTINNVFFILFDTLVVVVTLYNTLGLVRCSREFHLLPQKSLTQMLAEQGRLIHHYTLK
jgi:hypothetical protein